MMMMCSWHASGHARGLRGTVGLATKRQRGLGNSCAHLSSAFVPTRQQVRPLATRHDTVTDATDAETTQGRRISGEDESRARPPSQEGGEVSAGTQSPQREYFYWVDLRGHLYCIDQHAANLPRQNDPAFLRDGRFVNFFWRQLRLNTPESPGRALHTPTYPYVSPCGRELNFVKAADRPIVFHSLSTEPSGGSSLLYAHDLSVPFEPTALRVKSNGRIYHPCSIGLGLLRSALASELSGAIEAEGEGYVFTWRGTRYPIKALDDSNT